MFQLARVRLESVGPVDARFDPLALDFTDGEAPIDTLLWLVNGGGKTVLTKLLFAVARPDQVRLIGADRVEGSAYRGDVHPLIHAHDTAHVMLEWRAPDGRRLVTGVVMEWRDGHAGDRSNLRRTWYSFTPRAELLDFELLAGLTSREGRRVRLAGFVNALRAQASAIELNLVIVADTMRRWVAHLDDIGLDPELFTYQLQMNRDEGGVEKLFQFRKEIDFIKFLLELVSDRGQLQIVSDNLAKLADRVAAQPQAELELEFVRGALAELEPLAEAEAALRDAEQEQVLAEARARRLLHGFRARLAEDEAKLEELRREAEGYEREKVEHGRVRRRAAANAAELGVLVAGFALADAERQLAQAKQTQAERRRERDAWRVLEPLARQHAAAAARAELEVQFSELEQGAAPLAARRAEAARRFAGRLAADSAAHRDAEQNARELAAAATGRAREATTRTRTLEREREQQASEQRELGRLLRSFEEALLALREEGALARGETVAAALVRLAEERRLANERVSELGGLIEGSEARRGELEEETAGAGLAATTAQAEHTTVLAELEPIERELTALTANERLRELAETEEPPLEEAGQELVSRLSEAAAAADRGLIDLEAALVDDRHALRVLEDEGLLPPTRDLETALERLEAGGISASSGWHYLAHAIPLDRRERLLERHPELAGAIVLAEPLQRKRAEALLAEAGLTPRSVLLVADSQELIDALASEERRFAVPPDAALYDGGRASEAKRTLGERLEAADRELAALGLARERDRALARRLRDFLAAEPFTTIRRLRERAEALAAEAEQALARRERLRNELRALAEEVREWRAEERERGTRLAEIAALEARLQPHAQTEAEEPERRSRLVELVTAASRLDEELRALELAREQAERESEQARERAGDERAAAQRLDLELGERGLAGDPADAPATPLEELRAAFIEADRALREATSESDLAARLRTAGEEEARLERECRTYAPEALARAEELLLSEQASDPGARAAALGEADRVLEEAGAAVIGAEGARDGAVAAEQDAKRQLTSADRRLIELPQPPPADLAAAEAALAAERELQAQETARETQSENLERETRTEIGTRESAARELENFAAMLERVLGEEAALAEDEPAPATFTGTTDRAQTLFHETIDEVDRRRKAVAEAKEAVGERATRIQRFVYDPHFQPLATTALRARLVSEHLPSQAAYLASELRKRERALSDSLDQIAVHKRAAVSELAANVDQARQNLRAAERLSRLPDSLGAWGGKQFLRIDADWWASDEELQARLGVVVEEVAHGEVRLSGVPLLVRALEGAVGRNGFRSRLLKPAISDRGEYVTVTEAGGTSSGGQGATLAILLYCSLCALRAHNRGARATRTTLVLDNPIGKASADFLIEKQRAVASALGVQLIYTTGVNDLGALDHFPKLIRLRNDQELRQNVGYVHLDSERLNALLGSRDGGNGSGYLAAAQLFET